MEKIYKVGDLVYDANVYDGLNTNLNDLNFYKKWLPKDKTKKILELCCGTGRLTIPIAKDGYKIVGVDNTLSMIEKAKLKAFEENVEIEFILDDIRNFDLSDKYDFIFIPFNSIHHLYQNQDLFMALNCVKKHLKKNGLFLLDCYNPNIKYIVDAEKSKNKIAEYSTSDGRKIMIQQCMRYENKTQVNRIEWNYYINNEFDSVQNLDMRLYFPQELDSYLDWNGFKIQQKFGSFDEEEFNDNSEKQIFVCGLTS